MPGKVKYRVKTVLHGIIFIDTSARIKYLQAIVFAGLDKTRIAPDLIAGNAVFRKIEILYSRTIIPGHETLCGQPYGTVIRLFKRIYALAVQSIRQA